jgi:hypothetical protein
VEIEPEAGLEVEWIAKPPAPPATP